LPLTVLFSYETSAEYVTVQYTKWFHVHGDMLLYTFSSC